MGCCILIFLQELRVVYSDVKIKKNYNHHLFKVGSLSKIRTPKEIIQISYKSLNCCFWIRLNIFLYKIVFYDNCRVFSLMHGGCRYCNVESIACKELQQETLLTHASNVMFLQVFEILNSAELVCLMRYISVPCASVSECIVATNQSCKKIGVWIGSGNTEAWQLSFTNLNADGHICQVDIDKGICHNCLRRFIIYMLYPFLWSFLPHSK